MSEPPTSLSHRNEALVGLALSILLAAAFVLRVWGTNFGLPAYVYHPDEPAIVERAANIMRTGVFNPQWFHYPTGYIYTQVIAYIGYFLWGAIRGSFAFVPEYTLPQFYLVGRLTTAVFGTLTVLVVYLTGQKAYRARVGFIAAVLSAFSYLSIVHAHYVTTDVPSGFWVALCALFTLLILQRKQMSWYVLAGLAGGLAAGTKYNAGLVILLIPWAHVLNTKWGEWGYLDRRLALGLLAALAGFLVSTPYALLDLPTFLNGLGFELNHYNTYQPGYTGHSALWYLQAVFTSADAPLGLAYLGGLVHAAARPTKCHLLLLAFPVVYYLGLARTAVHFERSLLPILPVLCVLASAWLDSIVSWVVSRRRPQEGRYLSLLPVVTGLVVGSPLVAGLLFDQAITRLDIRPAAGKWVSDNLPAGAKIAVEHYSIPFPRDQYTAVDVLRLWDHDATWYAEQEFDYIIASNGVWLTLPKESGRYARELDVFQDISTHYTLVAEFIPQGVPSLITAGYSTVAEYHFAHVWVFRVTGGHGK